MASPWRVSLTRTASRRVGEMVGKTAENVLAKKLSTAYFWDDIDLRRLTKAVFKNT
jgi:hypothetical protein